MDTTKFKNRHIGSNANKQKLMLDALGLGSIESLIKETIPEGIRLKKNIYLPKELSEFELLGHLKNLGRENINTKNYIGLGYHPTFTPPVIQRNILENPGWYSAYTPYQAEIAQGRLEALLNFQTMISDLTGLPITNASLLDEGTAAAEAMSMFVEGRTKDQKKDNINKFFVEDDIFPQTLAVLKTKAYGLGVELIIGKVEKTALDATYFGALLQYPNKYGSVKDYTQFADNCKEKDIQLAVSTDLMALTLLVPPGEWGADVALGTTQRFGIPMGFGGPHAAFFCAKERYKRFMPGRIIGMSEDKFGKPALRMALQTREQHIKRERATSNICTAQVLLAVMAGMYGVYNGPDGLKFIATNLHTKAVKLSVALKEMGYELLSNDFFDTVTIVHKTIDVNSLRKQLEAKLININYAFDGYLSITVNELMTDSDLDELIAVFASFKSIADYKIASENLFVLPKNLQRKSSFMTAEVFHSHRTETELMRYIKKLERKDLSLNHSMIALGSCTMKLNAAAELLPLSWTSFNAIHPFAPEYQTQGYRKLIADLEVYLSDITGFFATSLQPNSGAQGEYAGLMVIKAFHESRGDTHRDVVLIPESAHGTNPASAVLAGMKVVVVKNKDSGEIDIENLTALAEKHRDNLSALMVTYPSTYGVFDVNIKEVTALVHKNGGQVYMDGANMNAQVGYTSPAAIGTDVCHLNLHKTFAIPHGGGGPGVGPICVAEHLAQFLPKNPLLEVGGKKGLDAISAAPFGSALILLISYAYIRMLGEEGLRESTAVAILNANYIKHLLQDHYDVLYTNENKRVAHEMIIDCRKFKAFGIEATDIAKRLIDYGYHSPTVSFPVTGTLMIEPTESESKEELDRFAEALISIKNEIDDLANGIYEKDNNPLNNSPHTLDLITADEWDLPYSREKAAYPLEWVKENKFWPSVARINESLGDRNLICTCPDTASYMEANN